MIACSLVFLGLALPSVSARAQALGQLAVAAHALGSEAPGPEHPVVSECRSARNVGASIGAVVGLGVGVDLLVQIVRKSFLPFGAIAFAPVIVLVPAVAGAFLGAEVGEVVCGSAS